MCCVSCLVSSIQCLVLVSTARLVSRILSLLRSCRVPSLEPLVSSRYSPASCFESAISSSRTLAFLPSSILSPLVSEAFSLHSPLSALRSWLFTLHHLVSHTPTLQCSSLKCLSSLVSGTSASFFRRNDSTRSPGTRIAPRPLLTLLDLDLAGKTQLQIQTPHIPLIRAVQRRGS